MKTTLRRHLQQTHSEQELRQWFEPLSISADEPKKTLSVVFPHLYFGQWFKQNVQHAFEEKVAQVLGNGYRIAYGCAASGAPPEPVRPARLKGAEHPFGEQFTFTSFLVNSKNQFPIASAREVFQHPGVLYNPFIICGGPSSGKTHLLRAMGNELAQVHEPANIFFGSVEELAGLYAGTFEGDRLRARRYLQGFHCLLVDDLQQARHHPLLHEELVLLFNHFHQAKRQMVFCCAGRLADYDFLDPTLKSRLEWGLIITLKEPDLDIRVKYIQNICKARRIKLSKEQMLTLAQRFTDLRYLQGILLKFFAFRKLVHKNIQDKDFNQILNHAAGEHNGELDPKNILAVVAEHFKVPVKAITGSKRDHAIVYARQVAMFLCRQLTGCSYPALGKLFGGKDHSTAMYAVNKIAQIQEHDPEANRMLISLKKKCLAAQES